MQRSGWWCAILAAAGARCAGGAPAAGVTHTHFVAAEEVEWDYAPSGIDRISGQPPEGPVTMLMSAGPTWLGRVYKKAIYREYTDSTFSTPRERPAAWRHLGILGPLLRASVGDTLRVVFRNNASHPFSMHPHGVFYTKDSEGAPYDDGTADGSKADDGVPPGGTHVYVWPVPERAGPADMEGSSILWMYHSHTNETKDVNAGLMGPMIVTRRGMARADGSPTDVDREFVVAFNEVDENLSWYYEENIQRYAGQPAREPYPTTRLSRRSGT
jgi:manganese oxidase